MPDVNGINGIAVALVTVIGAVSGATVLVIQAIGKSKRDLLETQSALQRQMLQRVDRQDDKAEEIHSLVNGSAAAAAKREEALLQRVTELKKQIEHLQKTIATLQEARVDDAKTFATMSTDRTLGGS